MAMFQFRIRYFYSFTVTSLYRIMFTYIIYSILYITILFPSSTQYTDAKAIIPLCIVCSYTSVTKRKNKKKHYQVKARILRLFSLSSTVHQIHRKKKPRCAYLVSVISLFTLHFFKNHLLRFSFVDI